MLLMPLLLLLLFMLAALLLAPLLASALAATAAAAALQDGSCRSLCISSEMKSGWLTSTSKTSESGCELDDVDGDGDLNGGTFGDDDACADCDDWCGCGGHNQADSPSPAIGP
jgi:hypothetical protein